MNLVHPTVLRIFGAGLLFYLTCAISGHVHHSFPVDNSFHSTQCPAEDSSPGGHSCVPETALFHFCESARPVPAADFLPAPDDGFLIAIILSQWDDFSSAEDEEERLPLLTVPLQFRSIDPYSPRLLPGHRPSFFYFLSLIFYGAIYVFISRQVPSVWRPVPATRSLVHGSIF